MPQWRSLEDSFVSHKMSLYVKLLTDPAGYFNHIVAEIGMSPSLFRIRRFSHLVQHTRLSNRNSLSVKRSQTRTVACITAAICLPSCRVSAEKP